MKYLALILILFLVLPFIDAARVNINLHDSFEKDGRNITLVGISKDKALICVNNQRAIISKEKSKTINEVNFILKKVYNNSIRVGVKVYCDDCKCDNNCNNVDCLNFSEEEIQEEIVKEEEKEIIYELENTGVIENEGLDKRSILIAIFILLFFVIGIFILIKRS